MKPKSSQGLFLIIILKRKHHVSHPVLAMAIVLHCPSIDLSQCTPRGMAQTWTLSAWLWNTGFILEPGKQKYESGFERSPRIEQEPEGLDFSLMLWLSAYFLLFASANTPSMPAVWLADIQLPGSTEVGQRPCQFLQNSVFEENVLKKHWASLS